MATTTTTSSIPEGYVLTQVPEKTDNETDNLFDYNSLGDNPDIELWLFRAPHNVRPISLCSSSVTQTQLAEIACTVGQHKVPQKPYSPAPESQFGHISGRCRPRLPER